MAGVACGASPIPYATPGQFVGPLHEQLDWSFVDIGLGVTFGMAAVISPTLYNRVRDVTGNYNLASHVAMFMFVLRALLLLLLGRYPEFKVRSS